MNGHVVRLYESPALRVQMPEGAVELSMEKLDTVSGYRRNRVHLGAVLEQAAALERGEGAPGAVVEAVRLWFLHAFGAERYEEVFSTPGRRASYAWHERLFLAAMQAQAESRAAYVDAAVNSPELAALRQEAAVRLRENAAVSALAWGSGDASAAGVD